MTMGGTTEKFRGVGGGVGSNFSRCTAYRAEPKRLDFLSTLAQGRADAGIRFPPPHTCLQAPTVPHIEGLSVFARPLSKV